MYYDLNTLGELSRELGFPSLVGRSQDLQVSISAGVVLVFQNLPDKEDTIIGFEGTPWHSHGTLILAVGDASYAEFDELDILQGIDNGDIAIGERYLNNVLEDRWLMHRNEAVDVSFIQAGEEVRIWRRALRSPVSLKPAQ